MLGKIGNITSLTLLTSDFVNVTSSFNANEIFLNFGASDVSDQGYEAVFSYDVAAVPLPATLPLLLVAGGALAFVRRSRRAS